MVAGAADEAFSALAPECAGAATDCPAVAIAIGATIAIAVASRECLIIVTLIFLLVMHVRPVVTRGTPVSIKLSGKCEIEILIEYEAT